MTDNSEFPKPRLDTTGDGSHTLYSKQFDQHYHNPKGAVAESRHNFFDKNGLLKRLPIVKTLTILEVGFGTGLNLLLLMDEYRKSGSDAQIDYYSIEGFPVEADTARSFNHDQFLDNPELLEKLVQIFDDLRPGLNHIELIPGITLHLFVGMFKEFTPKNIEADFIFHDPFSPDVNDELWTGSVFSTLADWSSRDVVLTTYSAASKARGAMASAGWNVAREEGALGKREMTVATLDPDKLSHLERVNEKRLARRYRTDDF